MDINSDFDKRVALSAHEAAWTPSPVPGVDRRVLDRIGGEVARATSMVRYAPGAIFGPHAHDGGEEIFVLQGVFSDEHGDYPAGTYLRNPPGTSHTPFSRDGCMLFVKLWQFAPDDRQSLRIDTSKAAWYPGSAPGTSVMPLHEHAGVNTALVRWAPNTRINTHKHIGGEEILVLAGTFSDENGTYAAGTWLRSPRGSRHTPRTGPEGTILYMKVGGIGARFMTPAS